MSRQPPFEARRFWQPRFWGLWLAIGLVRVAGFLPVPWQMAIGRNIGRALWRTAHRRRHYATVNIALCFPELDAAGVSRLVKRHFESLGMSVMEMGLAWFSKPEKLRERTSVSGLHHLEAALESGRGILLYTGHFTTLEAAGPRLQLLISNLYAVYRQHKNPMIDALFMHGRELSATVIPKDSTRAMIRALRKGGAVWYAPDQAYTGKLSDVLDFFGEPAMTNVATSQLVDMSNAVVIPFFPRRTDDRGQWHLFFGAPIKDFPTDNAAADTERLTRLLEEHIRTCPEQYYWIHRRFKNRPEPMVNVYEQADSDNS